jgi:hypothetical protein
VKITGDIVIGAEADAFAGATAYVYLEDVGRVDASAKRIGVTRLEGVAYSGRPEGRIPFVVEPSNAPETQDVVIRVHISRDGSEDVSSGDFVSTTHIAATADGPIDVPVREI